MSLSAGYFAALVFGTTLLEARLDLIYLTQAGVDSRSNPGVLKSISGLATSQEVLLGTIEKVNTEKVKVPISKKALVSNLSLSETSTPNQILLKLKWSDPQAAQELLTVMVGSFVRSVKHLHDSDVKGREADAAPKLAKFDDEIAKLRQEKQDYLKNGGVADLAVDLTACKVSIADLESTLRKKKLKKEATKEEYKETLKQMDDLKKTIMREWEEPENDPAVIDSISDNRRRQQRIRELMNDEKEHIANAAGLEAKLKEKKQLEDLQKQGKGSTESLPRLESEISVLKAKLEGNRKLIELENELQKIDRLIVPRKGPKPTSPIITPMLEKKMDRELSMMGLAREIELLDQEIEAQRTRLLFLQSREVKANEFDQKIANLEKERSTIQSQLPKPVNGAPILVRHDDPSTDLFPASSNRPTIFATVFLSGSALSILAVLLYELVLGIRLPSDVARSLRIPVRWISASPAYATADYRELCRTVRSGGFLAKTVLQIQPLAKQADGRAQVAQTTEGLANAFSERGEKVLIFDLCQTSSEMPGLAEALHSPDEAMERFLQPAATDSKIFRLLAGKEEPSAAQLADSPMRAFLEKALNRFQVILIQGQGLSAVQQVEALGLATHGLVIVSIGNRKIDPSAREALLDLTAVNLEPRALVVV